MGHHFWCSGYQGLRLTSELGITEVANRMDGQCRFPCLTTMSGEKNCYVWGEVELLVYFLVDVFMSYFFIGDRHHHQILHRRVSIDRGVVKNPVFLPGCLF